MPYEITIEFRDGRAPAKILAEEYDLRFDPQARGLQEIACKLADHRQTTIYLDPSHVIAVVPTVVRRDNVPQQPVADSGETKELGELLRRAREEGIKVGHKKALHRQLIERQQRSREKRASQTVGFDQRIIKALLRFGEATDEELRDYYPILREYRDGRLTAEVTEFFSGSAAARERLQAMEAEELIEGRGYGPGPYAATHTGAELVNMGLNPLRVSANLRNIGYYPKMLGLCQRILHSLGEDGEWITANELVHEEVRARREDELGRRLPSVIRFPASKAPNAPEGLLVLKNTGTTIAVGLELGMVGARRIEDYEAILDRFPEDPAIDRACFYFKHDEPRERVERMVRNRRGNEFFFLEPYRPDEPVDIASWAR